MQLLVDDLGDGDRCLPLPAGARNRRIGFAANEAELAALEEHAAIRRREFFAAIGAIGDHMADRQLAGKRLALRFEIDAGGEAFQLAAAGVRPR